jgi:uncharacterized protein (TIGR02646 family)
MPYRQPAQRLPNTIQFSAAEIAFLNSIKPWIKKQWSESFATAAEHTSRDSIKVEIKRQLLIIQNNYCAFCGLNLDLAYEVHREHIAPQYKHLNYIFETENLVLTCNFCNMHKGKKLTAISNTGNYATEVFKILHPHRDDFSTRLSCDFASNELVFKILNPDGGKTQETINCVGLAEPHLMSQRGAIILKDAMPKSFLLDLLVKFSIKSNRKRR